MTFFAIGNEFDSPGQEAAFRDLILTGADILHKKRPWHLPTDTNVIPEYSVIPYMPEGTVLYGAYNRFPRKTRWNWTTPDLVF